MKSSFCSYHTKRRILRQRTKPMARLNRMFNLRTHLNSYILNNSRPPVNNKPILNNNRPPDSCNSNRASNNSIHSNRFNNNRCKDRIMPRNRPRLRINNKDCDEVLGKPVTTGSRDTAQLSCSVSSS